MAKYLQHYGWHFSRKAYEYAVGEMRTRNGVRPDPIDKEQFREMLKRNNITLDNDVLYDGLYVLSMAMSDFFRSSLKDEPALVQFVKDYVDDVDSPDGAAFAKWYACCVRAGVPIDWDSMM